MQLLNEKIGIVTGASRGIGREIATLLAREGARVIVNYYSGADEGTRSDSAEQTIREIEDAGGIACAFDGDVSKVADVQKLIKFTLERYGTIDFLVNNAGIHPVASFFEVTEEMWDRVHSVNLKGVYLCTQAVAKVMIERKVRGRIVSISSISAIMGGSFQSHYCPTKAGVQLFMRCAAVALGPHGITCNSVLPGAIETDMFWDGQRPENVAALVAKTPVGRLGKPADVAAAVRFFLLNESEFINGASLVVDGGLIVNLQ